MEWVARPGGSASQELTREISWKKDVPKSMADEAFKWAFTKSSHVITEEAAVCVMALLLHDLENVECLKVLEPGSGGDYLVVIPGVPPLQAESSGIRVDPKGYLSTQRMNEKCEQVLKKSSAGFASVTAFSHSPSQDVRCQLRYVAKSDGAEGKSGQE